VAFKLQKSMTIDRLWPWNGFFYHLTAREFEIPILYQDCAQFSGIPQSELGFRKGKDEQ
jgi:hypothetical protein